jgi:hypothetical protein
LPFVFSLLSVLKFSKEGEGLFVANLAIESRTEVISSLVRNRGRVLKQAGERLIQGDNLPREFGDPKSWLRTKIIHCKRGGWLRSEASDV